MNWTMVAILIVISLPGIIIVLPGLFKNLEGNFAKAEAEGKKLPPRKTMMAITLLQSVVMVSLATVAGAYFAPQVGIHAPVFDALSTGQPVWQAIQPTLLPTLLVSLVGALGLIACYYWIFRPRLEPHNREISERLRNQLGIGSRILYGGVVEEVLFRWGVLPLLVWLLSLLFGSVTPGIFWAAVVVSGVIFGIGHLPSYQGAGCTASPTLITMMIVLNLWASLMFSYLLLNYGLFAAMLSHALFHIIWYPFDTLISRKTAKAQAAA